MKRKHSLYIFFLISIAGLGLFSLNLSQVNQPAVVQEAQAQTACSEGAIPLSGCFCTGQVRSSGWCCSDIYFRADQYSSCPKGKMYFVSLTGDNANPGTIDEPWRTIKYAASVLVAGDTVLVRGGTYNEGKNPDWYRPVIQPANSGTADAPITFKAYPGETVEIEDSGNPEIGSYWRDYIVWDGFIVHDGGVILAGESPRMKGCIIQNCIIEGAYVPTGDNHDGIRIQGTSGAIIRDNIIRNVTGDSWNSSGIKLYNNDNVLIEHNDIYGNTTGIFDKEEGTDNIYRRNIIHDNSTLNLLLHTQSVAKGCNTRGTKIYENIMYGSSSLYFTCDPGLDFANTEIYNNTMGAIGPIYAPNLKSWNNIFRGGYNCRVEGTPTESDYNNFYPSQTFKTGIYTPAPVSYNTLLQWQQGTGMDLNSTTTDPLFIDASNRDYHLAENSPLKGTGKDGLDIGAYPRADNTVIGPRPDSQILPQGQPQITLTKQADKTSVQPGQELTYTITYQNTGQAEAKNLQITDAIPQGTSYVQGSAAAGGSYDGVKVAWTISNVSAGVSAEVSFRVRVD